MMEQSPNDKIQMTIQIQNPNDENEVNSKNVLLIHGQYKEILLFCVFVFSPAPWNAFVFFIPLG